MVSGVRGYGERASLKQPYLPPVRRVPLGVVRRRSKSEGSGSEAHLQQPHGRLLMAPAGATPTRHDHDNKKSSPSDTALLGQRDHANTEQQVRWQGGR